MIVGLPLQQETVMHFKSPYGSLYYLSNSVYVQIIYKNLIKWKVWLKWHNMALHVCKDTS